MGTKGAFGAHGETEGADVHPGFENSSQETKFNSVPNTLPVLS